MTFFYIDGSKKDLVLEALSYHISEYLRVSQEISFQGTNEDRKLLNEYLALVFESLFMLSLGQSQNTCSWEDFIKSRRVVSNLDEEEKLIESVIYNLGSHSSSIPTGEKWELIEEEEDSLTFTALTILDIKDSQIQELKKDFPQIKDVSFSSFGGEMRLKLFLNLRN